ncbi:MAG: DUF4040 domain-containing protein [Spirochaetales bacterium]|nr:DUF4040 domain-containing protein [Spirochaetales bacterium]
MLDGRTTLDLVIGFLGLLMILAALWSVLAKRLLSSVLLSGGVSLLASLVFLALGAPDVAMTEAAIGSALTTMVFLYSLSRMKVECDASEDGGRS